MAPACLDGGGVDEARRQRKEIERLAPAAAEKELVVATNALRAERNLPPLAVHPHLVDTARAWSATMAREERLYHSPLSEIVAVAWSKLGENVGQGYRIGSIHERFVASPRHYANLVDPAFTHIGVGVAGGGEGGVFVTEVFMQPRLGPAPAPDGGITEPARRSGPPPPEGASAVSPQPSPRLRSVLDQLRRMDGR